MLHLGGLAALVALVSLADASAGGWGPSKKSRGGCAEQYRCCMMQPGTQKGQDKLSACVKESPQIQLAKEDKPWWKSSLYTCGKFWKRSASTELGQWHSERDGCQVATEYSGKTRTQKSQNVTKFVRHSGSHRKKRVNSRCCECQTQQKGGRQPRVFFDEQGNCQACAEMPSRTFAFACKTGFFASSCDNQCQKASSRTPASAAEGTGAGVGVFQDSRGWVWIRHGGPCAEGSSAAQGCGLGDFRPAMAEVEEVVVDQWGRPEKHKGGKKHGQIKTVAVQVPRHSVPDAEWQLAGWSPAGQAESEGEPPVAPTELPDAAPPPESTSPVRLFNVPPVCSRSMASLATFWRASQTSTVSSEAYSPNPMTCKPADGETSLLSWWNAQWCAEFWKCECVGPCSASAVECCMKAHLRALDSFIEDDTARKAWQTRALTTMRGLSGNRLNPENEWNRILARAVPQAVRSRRAFGEEVGVPSVATVGQPSLGGGHAWVAIREACGGAPGAAPVDLGCALWDFSQESPMAMGDMLGPEGVRGSTEVHWLWGPTLDYEPADHFSVAKYLPARDQAAHFPYPAYCARAAVSEISTVYNTSRGKNQEMPNVHKRGWRYIARLKNLKHECDKITEDDYRRAMHPESFHDERPVCWDFAYDWKVVMCHRYSKCKCSVEHLTERGECQRPELVECCQGQYEEFLKENLNFAGPFLRSSPDQRQVFRNASALVPSPESPRGRTGEGKDALRNTQASDEEDDDEEDEGDDDDDEDDPIYDFANFARGRHH